MDSYLFSILRRLDHQVFAGICYCNNENEEEIGIHYILIVILENMENKLENNYDGKGCYI